MKYIDRIEKAWAIRRSETQEAEAILKDVLKNSNNDGPDHYHATSVLGMIAIYQNKYQVAEKLLLESFNFYQSNMDSRYFSRTCNSLGVLYITQGLFSDAMLYLKKGLEVSRPNDENEMTIFMLYNVGEIYKAIHVYDKALPLLEDAIKLNKDKSHTLTAALLSSCAYVHLKMGHYDMANRYADQSMDLAATNDKYTYGLCYMVLGDIMIHHGKYEIAKSYSRKSIQARIEIDDRFALANNYLQLGIIAFHEGDYESSIKNCLKAKEMSSAMEGHALDDDVFKYLSKSYGHLKNYAKASMYCEKFAAEQDRVFTQRLSQTISIMTAESKFETLKRNAEYYKQTSENLRRENNTIQTITKIGQSIVNASDLEMLVSSIRHNLNALMDAKDIAIGLLDDDMNLRYDLILQDGRPLRGKLIHKTNKSYGLQSIHEKSTIYLSNYQPDPSYTRLDEGDQDDETRSCIFCPMFIEHQPVGVLSIQSHQAHAYSQEQIMLLEGIASFIAIAMDNVQKTGELRKTVQILEETRDALVKAETLAGLGQLVSGVAHELNTPIGSALTMNSYLIHRNEDLKEKLAQKSVALDDVLSYLDSDNEVLSSTQSAIVQASEMIQSFKTLATDKMKLKHQTITTGELLERIKLESTMQMDHKLTIHSHGEDHLISTYPSIFHEVFRQLILNSIHHSKATEIILKSYHDTSHTYFVYTDNGIPIPEDVRPRIFEPFYGTRKKDGFMGLGLHAVHNMITQVLHGTIQYEPHQYIISMKR